MPRIPGRKGAGYHAEADVGAAPFRYVDTTPPPASKQPAVWRTSVFIVAAAVMLPFFIAAVVFVLRG